MGIYTDAVTKQSQAQASNTGAVVNAVGNVAITLASMGVGAVAGAGIKAGIAMGGAKGLAKAQLGQQVQRMAFQMIGRQIGGFSGIVIGSNMADAVQQRQHGSAMSDLMASVQSAKAVDKAEAVTRQKMEVKEKFMPREMLDKFGEGNTTIKALRKQLDELDKGGAK